MGSQGQQPPRHCACGTRLARDNRTDRCTACQKAASQRVVTPPAVPPDFWQNPALLGALKQWHIGQVIRVYRLHPHHRQPIPQAVVAGWFNVTQAQLSRIENGAAVTDLARLVPMATRLGIPSELLWFKLPNAKSPREAVRVVEPEMAPPMRPERQPTSVETAESGQTWSNGNTYASAMQSFRAADRQVGGGHLYATVVSYMQAEVAPRLLEIGHDNEGRHAFTAAAGLTEMAGWMAHDAGRNQVAGQHFGRALDLVKLGTDRQLGVHILASMSHLANHQGKPAEAIQCAERGRQVLAKVSRLPQLEARLLAMQARGFAGLGRRDESTRLLGEAERLLERPPEVMPSTWVSSFDEGSLANEAARCLRQLGDLSGARRQAERVIELRPGDRTRSRAFGQLLLASVLIPQGRLDEACALAQEVLGATQQLGSGLVHEQLLDLRLRLEPHRDTAVVADFLEQLDEALEQRTWLYQWMTQGGQRTSGTPTELR